MDAELVETAVRMLRSAGVVRNVPIPAKEGGFSPCYVEIKELFGQPQRLAVLADALHSMFPQETTCVAATGFGGLPLATAISLRHALSLTLIRESPKAHGKGGVVEGYRPSPTDRVAVVDDKTVTGDSLRRTAAAVERLGALVIGLFVVVDVRPDLSAPAVMSVACLQQLQS